MLSRPPSYVDRDVDVISLRSTAPSYTSSLPPVYTPRTYTSLIPPTSTPEPIPGHHSFSVASWPSLSNQSQSRAYLNVAARRARRAQEEAQAEDVRRALRIGESNLANVTEEAAGEGSSSGPGGFEEELRRESRAWDFFTAQISDWEQRQVSWKAFKAKYDRETGKKQGKAKTKGRRKWGFYGRLG
jgi:hypothetical protein